MGGQPSRLAAADDEAISHFFAHYNEKFFASAGQPHAAGGFDYILPVFLQDMASGGPIPEIIRASGLAALGNMKGSPELLVAARGKQVKVLRQLNQQLQNPRTALSDSSILTCIMLGVFEVCPPQMIRTWYPELMLYRTSYAILPSPHRP
jgi:hypothetical protein